MKKDENKRALKNEELKKVVGAHSIVDNDAVKPGDWVSVSLPGWSSEVEQPIDSACRVEFVGGIKVKLSVYYYFRKRYVRQESQVVELGDIRAIVDAPTWAAEFVSLIG